MLQHEIIFFIREFFDILSNHLANRLFFSVFKMYCQYCDREFFETFTINQHYQRFIKCFEIIRYRIAQYIQEIRKQIQLIEQKTQKQTELIEQKIAKRTKIKIIEIVKSTLTFCDIDIFDSTFIYDILKFDLYSKMINFLQYFQQI